MLQHNEQHQEFEKSLLTGTENREVQKPLLVTLYVDVCLLSHLILLSTKYSLCPVVGLLNDRPRGSQRQGIRGVRGTFHQPSPSSHFIGGSESVRILRSEVYNSGGSLFSPCVTKKETPSNLGQGNQFIKELSELQGTVHLYT